MLGPHTLTSFYFSKDKPGIAPLKNLFLKVEQEIQCYFYIFKYLSYLRNVYIYIPLCVLKNTADILITKEMLNSASLLFSKYPSCFSLEEPLAEEGSCAPEIFYIYFNGFVLLYLKVEICYMFLLWGFYSLQYYAFNFGFSSQDNIFI